MTKQPEALRLADALENMVHMNFAATDQAAAELRRLHEVNAELVEALSALLKRVMTGYDGLPQGRGVIMAEAAIAKATGEQ